MHFDGKNCLVKREQAAFVRSLMRLQPVRPLAHPFVRARHIVNFKSRLTIIEFPLWMPALPAIAMDLGRRNDITGERPIISAPLAFCH